MISCDVGPFGSLLQHCAAIFLLTAFRRKKNFTMSKLAELPLTLPAQRGGAAFARSEDGASPSSDHGAQSLSSAKAQFSSFSMEELPQMDLKLPGAGTVLRMPHLTGHGGENPPL